MKKWITLEEECKHKAPTFSYTKLKRKSAKTGKTGDFDRLDCADWVNIIARTKENNIVMVRQYRHGIDEITEEIPGGAIDPGEDPLVAAKRELAEETGYVSENWYKTGEVIPNPAMMKNKCLFYFADQAEKREQQNLDPFEEIDVYELSMADLNTKITKKQISHSLVIAALYYFDRFLNSHKES